jgi:hypothetical protein
MCEFHAQRTNKRKCENKFGNNPMKMCCKHKIRMKIDHRIKDIYIYIYIYSVFIVQIVIFDGAFFVMNF